MLYKFAYLLHFTKSLQTKHINEISSAKEKFK